MHLSGQERMTPLHRAATCSDAACHSLLRAGSVLRRVKVKFKGQTTEFVWLQMFMAH